ncbi:hypothetical protein LTR85_000720 [Meristemomyces frigidus]|nr:hypothetical protein LTR85_000720 [Meristemomyces frigidus]
MPCPFSNTVSIVTAIPNGTTISDFPYGYNTTLPSIIRQIYSSGLKDDSTISGYFDIQWRRYTTISNSFANNGSTFLVSANKHIDTLVQNNAIIVVEGLIVDAIQGGIGFRNHTVPQGYSQGASWSEDLLFIEPETVCVDTNLTLDYEILNTDDSVTAGIFLTDRGGFVNLNHSYPYRYIADPQNDPSMQQRAYEAAWIHNAYTALMLNVTSPKNGTSSAFSYMTSSMNQTFQIAGRDEGIGNFNTLTTTTQFDDYLTGSITDADGNNIGTPWNIGSRNYSDINVICAGAGSGDYANITNILVFCGLMRSAPQRANEGSGLVFETGSKWSQKMFACATAVKATVKSVDFRYNVSDGSSPELSSSGIHDKTYADEASTPLWGVEDTGNAYRLSDLTPVWGLVSPQYEGNLNVSTVRQSSLYLPGWLEPLAALGNTYGDWENMPGSDFSMAALSRVYSVGDSNSDVTVRTTSTTGKVDYSGQSSLAMFARWQNLSSNSETASLILDLIWTDQASSLVVGTKGVLGPGNTASSNAAYVLVTPSKVVVRYHIMYAIPALLCALMLLLITVAALLSICMDGGSIACLRQHLQELSPGRVYTVLLAPGDADLTMSGREWNKRFGSRIISLSDEVAAQKIPCSEQNIPERVPFTAEHPREHLLGCNPRAARGTHQIPG